MSLNVHLFNPKQIASISIRGVSKHCTLTKLKDKWWRKKNLYTNDDLFYMTYHEFIDFYKGESSLLLKDYTVYNRARLIVTLINKQEYHFYYNTDEEALTDAKLLRDFMKEKENIELFKM